MSLTGEKIQMYTLVYSTTQHVSMRYVHRKQKHGNKLRDSTRCRGVPEAGSPVTPTLGEKWGHRCEPSRMGTRSPRRGALLPSPLSSTVSPGRLTTATLPRSPGRALGTPSKPHPSVQDVNRQDGENAPAEWSGRPALDLPVTGLPSARGSWDWPGAANMDRAHPAGREHLVRRSSSPPAQVNQKLRNTTEQHGAFS